MAGPYRAASRKIPAPREMFIGMGLGLTVCSFFWRLLDESKMMRMIRSILSYSKLTGVIV